MYIGLYNYYTTYNKNKMINDPSSSIGDNLMYPFFYLAQELRKLGHSVATIDTDDLKKFDAIIFVEFPGVSNTYFKQLMKNGFQNLYLLALESPIVKPDNLSSKTHAYFKKVFTWQDELIDNKKYFKANYAHKIPESIEINLTKKEKLCTLISSNQHSSHPLGLYKERVNAIRWFEQNHPEDFDLYGKNWDRYHFQGTVLGFKIARFNRLTFLTKLLASHYPSYKGSVKSKKETYQKYKFSICYENVKDFKGYITEKIFDCFFGSCVPIYWGASNVTDHIPANTFINKRDFSRYEDLYSYIKHMPEKEYLDYLESIQNFLRSDKASQFSAEYFANTLIKEIVQ